MTDEPIRVGIIGLNPGIHWAATAHIPALKAFPDASDLAPLTPPASAYDGWPDNSVARNVARVHALVARDIRQGTRSAPGFRDAVALHEVTDAIERSAAGGAPK